MPCFNKIRTPAMLPLPEENKCVSGFGGKPSRPRWLALAMLMLAVVAIAVAKISISTQTFLLLKPSSSQNIRGLNEIFSTLSPVANATAAATSAPTRKPTGFPTEAPTCAVNLPNNVTALAVVNLQFQPNFDDAITVDTTFFIDQLAEIFQGTYNRINDVKYSPCDEAYRRVTKVRHIDLSNHHEEKENNNTSYTPSSFSFRRRLLARGEEIDNDGGQEAAATAEVNTPLEITTHYVRIGRSSDALSPEGGGRRIQQNQQQRREEEDSDKWMHISLLFEATIACRGLFCIGDNAELFGPVVINKNEFSQVYAENVARSLRWKPTSSNTAIGNEKSSGAVITTTASNNNSAPSAPAPPTAFVVETVREIEEQSCPLGDQQVDFTRLVIVELVQGASSDPFASPDDPRFEAIEEAYVSTYNQLIRNEFCDPFFRRLTKAEAVAVGVGKSTRQNVVSVEMRIFGECRGCDPSDIDVYAIPSVLVGPTKASSSSSARSLLAETNNSNYDDDGDMWLLPSPKKIQSEGRSLQVETSNFHENETNKCYCDAQPFGNRAPFEAEFVSRFQRTVEALNLRDLSSVNSCQFGTTFSTGLVISFSQEEVRRLQEAADKDTKKSVLELSLKDTLNELLTVTNYNCNKDFRVIENVTMVLGTNITRSSPSYFGESNSGNEDMNLQLPSSTGPDSTIQVATIKSATTAAEISKRDATFALVGGNYRRSVLEEDSGQEWKKSVVRIENHTASSSDAIKCDDLMTNRTLLNENYTATDSNLTTIIDCDETIHERSDSPTYSPFDPAVMGRKSDSVPILFFISGVCSGCDNSMFTGLGNDVVRKLAATSLTPSPSVLQPSKYSRGLDEDEEEEIAKSDCFCPINATETSGELEASVVSKAYTANLKKESVVDSEVEILDEVDVVECEDAVQDFETTATLTLAGDLTDSDIDALARSFKDTYNYLNTLYCDPYFREITSIEDYEIFTRRRDRKSRKLQECFTETEIELYMRGTCLGCDDGQPLFDGDGSRNDDRRKRNLKSLFKSYKLSTVYDTESRRTSRRRLQDSDVCFCEGDTIDDRAPSFDEFYSIYEEEALRVPEVCEVVEIEAEEDEDEDFSENNGEDNFFVASEDYYEDFFRGSPAKAVTVPPAFLIDDVLSNDLSYSSGDESADLDEEDGYQESSTSSRDVFTNLDDSEEDEDKETSSSSIDDSEDPEGDEDDVDLETSSSSRDESEDLEEVEDDLDQETSSSSGDESEDPEGDEDDVDQGTLSSSRDQSEDLEEDEDDLDQETSSSSGDESEDLEEGEDDVDQETSSVSGDTSTDPDDEEDVDKETSSSSGDASEDLEEDEDDVDKETSSSSGDASEDLEVGEDDVDQETSSSSGDTSTDLDDKEDVTSSSSGDASEDLDEGVHEEAPSSSGDSSTDLDDEEDGDKETSSSSGDASED